MGFQVGAVLVVLLVAVVIILMAVMVVAITLVAMVITLVCIKLLINKDGSSLCSNSNNRGNANLSVLYNECTSLGTLLFSV